MGDSVPKTEELGGVFLLGFMVCHMLIIASRKKWVKVQKGTMPSHQIQNTIYSRPMVATAGYAGHMETAMTVHSKNFQSSGSNRQYTVHSVTVYVHV